MLAWCHTEGGLKGLVGQLQAEHGLLQLQAATGTDQARPDPAPLLACFSACVEAR